jgi:hypothetical protein
MPAGKNGSGGATNSFTISGVSRTESLTSPEFIDKSPNSKEGSVEVE